MSFVLTAVALVGALGVLNLLLSVGVIRRLRRHTELLAKRPAEADDDVPASAAPVGTAVGGFRARSTGGDPVSERTLGDRAVVAFFSPDCSPCRKRLPSFVEYAARRPELTTLAVVSDEEGHEEMAASLASVTRVVVEPFGGELHRAFEVQGTPSFITVAHGTVTATSVFAPVTPVGPATGGTGGVRASAETDDTELTTTTAG
jgi:thiol-disulfide isomerase/thioredoxin